MTSTNSYMLYKCKAQHTDAVGSSSIYNGREMLVLLSCVALAIDSWVM
jgi:hypothetical protein